jgi:tRNA G18 (ribose-2'-O)-methylase SpoU
MPQVFINDMNDERLAPYRHLKLRNATRWSSSFIVEGDKLVERLLASNCDVESVLLDEGQLKRAPNLPSRIPVYVIPTGAAAEIVGFNFHRGALACGIRPANIKLSDLGPIPLPNHSVFRA